MVLRHKRLFQTVGNLLTLSELELQLSQEVFIECLFTLTTIRWSHKGCKEAGNRNATLMELTVSLER